MTAKLTQSKSAHKKKSSLRKGDGKPSESNKARTDPMESIWKSRQREREEMLESQRELREMVLESQMRILAMRTKGNLARLKLVNKAFDD